MAAKQNVFDVSIESCKEFKLGEEVSIGFSLTNNAKQDYFILTWNTPFQGVDSHQFKMIFKNEKIKYHGLRVKRLEPTPQSYILIKSGQTKRVSVIINESYYLEKPGTYSLTLMTHILDHFETTKSMLQVDSIPLRKDFCSCEIVSNEIQFECVEDRSALMPFGIREKTRTLKLKSIQPPIQQVQQPTFVGGTDYLRSITTESHYAAQQMSQLSLQGLGSSPSKHYIEWFGVNNAPPNTRFENVCDNYNLMNGLMQGPIIYNFDDPHKICSASTLAYTSFGSDTIYCCPAYETLPTTGTDTKPGTILHEYTHKSINTEDYVYGTQNCHNLARTNPDKAINNADNYEYFSETSVHGNQILYAYHQGFGANKELWVSALNDSTWSKDWKVENVGITCSPSVILFMGILYIFHNGYGGNELWYLTYDGRNSSQDTKVLNVGIASSPAAVVYENRIYVFHRGYGTSMELWYSTFDGAKWSIDVLVSKVGISNSPSAVVFGDKLYVFHQGWNNNSQLWYSVYDGNIWYQDQQIPNVNMSFSPAAMSYLNKLFVFYHGSGKGGGLWYCAFNGKYWGTIAQVQNVGISKSPSVCLYNKRLYCFHEGGQDNGEIWYIIFDGFNFMKDVKMQNVGTTGSPGIATAIFLSS